MTKIELPTAIVISATLACLTICLTIAPADVRTQMLAIVGSLGTALAGVLPRLVKTSQ